MIRFTWFRFRTQALVAAGVLAALAVVLLVTGIRLADAYDAAVAACKPHGDCASALRHFPSSGYLAAGNGMHLLVIAVPCVLGMFWGAPLAAREFETGTFRLAWTQGSTRTRWLAVKLAVAGTASMAVAGLLSRRTVPAMAVTLAIFAAVVWFAFPAWVRPHLLPPAQATVPLSTGSVDGFEFTSPDQRALFVETAPPDIPGAWILSAQLTTPDGRPVSTVPATGACGPNAPGNSCQAYVLSLHLRQEVTYQPASRYWPLQWYETGIYLALAFALGGLCLWWIRPGRFAGLDVRHRTSPPAPALQSSP